MADVNVDLAEVLKVVGNQIGRRDSTYNQLVEFVQIILNQERLPVTSDVLQRLDSLTSAIQQLETKMARKEDVQAIKTSLEASNATIAEIAGDMAELTAGNTTLTQKVTELEAAVAAMNDPELDRLVADVKTEVDRQTASLRSIADVVPETQSPEPPPDTGTGGGGTTTPPTTPTTPTP